MGSPSFLTSPMFNIAFMLVTMQVGKKIDWEDPSTLMIARIGYYGAQVLVLLLAYALMQLVKNKNDTTVLKYTETKAGATQGQQVETTTVAYDVAQVQQFIQSTLTSVAMISLMHWQFKFTQPLLLQSILPFKNLLAHKIALIYLWGDAPEGALKRPFQAENPFAALMGGASPTAEPAAAAAVDDGHEKKD
ncbi:inorganic phosphate transporter [Halteromyces radiatus]|uniref:inorganic phosphate transporter n=1 Tax=Halteromyces radiatus TaxID=101107 RepID=UPI0022201522|nr:inorganic phosphate transporter [Halteromyces radiatus]KAI8093370.1 inorganic phosphate transporter [Halteromyces radiatus]